jgi:hypothetical protein
LDYGGKSSGDENHKREVKMFKKFCDIIESICDKGDDKTNLRLVGVATVMLALAFVGSILLVGWLHIETQNQINNLRAQVNVTLQNQNSTGGEWRCDKYMVKKGFSRNMSLDVDIDGLSVIAVYDRPLVMWCVVPKKVNLTTNQGEYYACWANAIDNPWLTCKEEKWRRIKNA